MSQFFQFFSKLNVVIYFTIEDDNNAFVFVVHGLISVEKSGAAREAGIAEGDIITMIDNQKVTSVRHFKELAGGLNPGRPAALLVQRKSGPTFLAISPEDS